ncbi:MAG: glycosyltransferase family 2 protein [Balneolales bacterium]
MKISIITVCYNSASTIERTFKSIINSKHNDIEYIVIDGGSTDGTIEIIGKYKDYISVFVSENDNGLWDAMNKGILLSSGDVIGILNSDDYYNTETLSIVNRHFEDYAIDYLMGPVKRGLKIRKTHNPNRIKFNFNGTYTSHSVGFFCSSNVYNEIGLYNIRYHSADYDFFLKIYNKGYKGMLSDNDYIFGEFEDGGYSAKVSKFGKILEQAEIRRLNGFSKVRTLFLLLLQIAKSYKKI